MSHRTFRILALALVATAGLVTAADAIIGRPLTPMSYAGVARRTAVAAPVAAATAVAVGTAAAVTTAAAVDATAGCVTTYNAYGQPVTTCP